METDRHAIPITDSDLDALKDKAEKVLSMINGSQDLEEILKGLAPEESYRILPIELELIYSIRHATCLYIWMGPNWLFNKTGQKEEAANCNGPTDSILKKQKFSSSYALYVMASYIVNDCEALLKGKKTETLATLRPIFRFEPGRNFTQDVQILFTYYVDALKAVNENGVSLIKDALDIIAISRDYWKAVADRALDVVKKSDASIQAIVINTSFKHNEFIIHGLEIEHASSVKSISFVPTQPEAIVGNTEAVIMLLRLCDRLALYDADIKNNPLCEIGGIYESNLLDGCPGTGKTSLTKMAMTRLAKRADQVGLPYLFKNLEVSSVKSEWYGKSGKILSEIITAILDPATLALLLVDDIDLLISNRDDPGCITGDTKILLLDGTSIPIKDLVNKDPFWVYSYDIEHKGLVAGKATKVVRTKKLASIYKVTLDNGSIIRCTKDHLWLSTANSYIETNQLQSGQSIRSIYFRKTKKGYLQFSTGNKSRNYTDHDFVHVRIAKWKYNRNRLVGEVCHHINENKLDNSPENVEYVSQSWHNTHHNLEGKAILAGSLSFKNRSEISKQAHRLRIQKFNSTAAPNLRNDVDLEKLKSFSDRAISKVQLAKLANCSRSRIDDLLKKNGYTWSSFIQEFKFPITNLSKAHNHKILNVEFDGYEDVYDLVVDKYHNFAVDDGNGNGLYLHNSGGADKDLLKGLMDFFSGIGTNYKGNYSSVATTNKPTGVDDALRQRFVYRVIVTGAETWEDYADLVAIQLRKPVKYGIVKIDEKGYKPLQRIRPKLLSASKIYTKSGTWSDVGHHVIELQKKNPNFTARSVKNAIDVVIAKAGDFEIPEEFFTNPSAFRIKPWDERVNMIKELYGAISTDAIMNSIQEQYDSEVRYNEVKYVNKN